MDALDDETYLDTSYLSIGEIKLVIHRATAPKPITEESPTVAPPRVQKVHESSKKAIAHRVKYVAGLALFPLYNT